MKKVLLSVLGITCCATTVYAAAPKTQEPTARLGNLNFSTSSVENAFLSPLDDPAQPSLTPRRPQRTAREEVGRWAYKISYIGSLLLTADHLVRSVDSVMESMEVSREDGTQLRLLMEPNSRGFDVMVRLSKPIGF